MVCATAPIVNQIFLPMVLRCARSARDSSARKGIHKWAKKKMVLLVTGSTPDIRLFQN